MFTPIAAITSSTGLCVLADIENGSLYATPLNDPISPPVRICWARLGADVFVPFDQQSALNWLRRNVAASAVITAIRY